jgi:hypothetical protein
MLFKPKRGAVKALRRDAFPIGGSAHVILGIRIPGDLNNRGHLRFRWHRGGRGGYRKTSVRNFHRHFRRASADGNFCRPRGNALVAKQPAHYNARDAARCSGGAAFSTPGGFIMARGVGGHSPANVQKYLKGQEYPADKKGLLKTARGNHAPAEVINEIEGLPDNQFHGPQDVMKGYGEEEGNKREERDSAEKHHGH